MKCPTCTYNNPQGATHCGMCYEVFNRSAADAFLRIARRDRLEFERKNGITSGLPSETETLQQSMDRLGGQIKEALPPVDWKAQVAHAAKLTLPYRKKIIGAIVLLFVITVVWWIASLHVLTSAFGVRPAYRVADPKPVQYLLSFTSLFKSWSERGDRLDTPLEDFRIDELGNFTLTPIQAKGPGKRLGAKTKEWIMIRRDVDSPSSQSTLVPASHPSLKGGSIALNAHGRVVTRDFPSNARLGRALNFLTPDFPNRRLKPGDTWKSPIAWVEQIKDWKIYWSGTMEWIFTGQDEHNSDILIFTGHGRLTPQVWESPDWAAGRTKQIRFNAPTAQATLTFNQAQGRVLERSLSYQGRLDFPIQDLAQIPWELRVGRRVRGPGRIVVNVTNRVDLRQN